MIRAWLERRRKRKAEKREERERKRQEYVASLPARMRKAAGQITGVTASGGYSEDLVGLWDLKSMLREAASEIERSSAPVEEREPSQGEDNE